MFAENLRLSASQCGQVGLAELQGALRLLSRRFQLLQLSAEEAVMLKAVALGNAGTPTRCSLCPTRKQSELSLPVWDAGWGGSVGGSRSLVAGRCHGDMLTA